jgi:hypothetical protein
MILTADYSTSTYARVPVLLVTKLSVISDSLNLPFIPVATVDHAEVISKEGDLDIHVEVAIVDTWNAGKQEAVVAALFLRNVGMTAIIGDLTKVPTDIVQDIHNFALKARAEGSPARTEALVMDDAMEFYGDITDVVRYFEEILLRSS